MTVSSVWPWAPLALTCLSGSDGPCDCFSVLLLPCDDSFRPEEREWGEQSQEDLVLAHPP